MRASMTGGAQPPLRSPAEAATGRSAVPPQFPQLSLIVWAPQAEHALLASSGFTAAWWAVAALAAVGAVTALGMSPRAAERPSTPPAVTAH